MVIIQYMLYVIIFFAQLTSAKKITILVLGSHMDNLLQDRMETAIDFARKQPEEVEITWYLTGGIKNKMDSLVQTNEADKMRSFLPKKWNYIIENKAQNTAENFAYFRHWIEKQVDSEIYVATSSFHYERAKKILDGIIPNYRYTFLLGQLDYPSCNNDEIIHSRNIRNDIRNAIEKYQQLF